MDKLANKVLRKQNFSDNFRKYNHEYRKVAADKAFLELIFNGINLLEAAVESGTNRVEADYISEMMEKLVSWTLSEKDVSDIRTRSDENYKRTMKTAEIGDRIEIYRDVIEEVRCARSDEELPGDYSDEEFAKEIIRFIFVQNQGMGDVISWQVTRLLFMLPIHYSKNKLMGMLDYEIDSYIGDMKENLNKYTDGIIREFMPPTVDEGDAEDYKDLCAFLSSMEKNNFKTPDDMQADPENLLNCTEKSLGDAEKIKDANTEFQKCLNCVEIICLCMDSMEKNKNFENYCDVIRNIIDYYSGQGISINEVDDCIAGLEGIIEKDYEYLYENDVTGELEQGYRNEIEAFGYLGEFEDLKRIALMSSQSDFIPADFHIDESQVTKEYIAEKKTEVREAYDRYVAGLDRMVRSRMQRRIISSCPHYFKSVEDMYEFILYALTTSAGKTEKINFVIRYKKVMNDDYNSMNKG